MGNGIAGSAAVLVMFCVATARAGDVEPVDPLEGLSLWEQFYTLRVGAGYSDNILFSDLNPKSSPMLVTGFDATITRLPLDGTEVNVFAAIDDRRYFDAGVVTNLLANPGATNQLDELRGERTILGLVQVKHDFSPDWQAGAAAQYFYEDQVVDLSVTEADLTALPVKGQQFLTRIEADQHFAGNLHWQIEAEWKRQLFQEPEVDDYSEYGPKISAGVELPRSSSIELSYQVERRDYDTRVEYATDGTPLAGTRLRYLGQNVELEWTHHFDEARHWRLQSRAAYGRNEDNGPGYFNFNRSFGELRLRYRDARWEVEARGRVSWYQYDEQLSDEHPGERRERWLTQAGLRATRRLGNSFNAFVAYEFEQARSNLSYDRYTVNVVSSGIEWEF